MTIGKMLVNDPQDLGSHFLLWKELRVGEERTTKMIPWVLVILLLWLGFALDVPGLGLSL